ncbi:MAG: hypothetical protein SFV17_02635 [Candidatus Obscuribacter sp.]|nr:hypothetical protein [Candidatus Obscuribacter sp.]
MNPFQIIATLRKLGNYLAGLFPFLSKIADLIASLLLKLPMVKGLGDLTSKLLERPLFSAIWKVLERFYWRTYSKDRLDLSQAPPQSLPILRPVFQLCVLLLLLLPFAASGALRVPIETFSGFSGTAPAWSVWLWLITLPLAWSCLLIGTGLSNRPAFIATALGALYFLATNTLLLPRAWGNILLGLTVLLSFALCERRLNRAGAKNAVLAGINGVLVGGAAGVQMTVMTPLRPWLTDQLHLPAAIGTIPIGLVVGITLGISLAMLSLRWSWLPTKPTAIPGLRGTKSDSAMAVWLLTLLLLAFLLQGLYRSNLGQQAGALLSSLNLSNAYLWPVWYFIGIGIMHKLLGSSKVVAKALNTALPAKILNPLLLVGLLLALLFCTSDWLAYYFAAFIQGGSTTEALCRFFAQLYQFASPYLFQNTMSRISTHWLALVLLAQTVLVLALALAGKLSGAVLNRLFYWTALAALLVWEYAFQFSSFARSPIHSSWMLFLFGVWLLWLMHTVGWSMSMNSSRLWPSRGRLAIYAAIVSLCILEIHARVACQDFRVTNEIFLAMFRGVIEVGPPYYLYLFASRRIATAGTQPISLKLIFSYFCLGALTSMAGNVLEKLASVHFQPDAFQALITRQLETFTSTGSINIAINHESSTMIVGTALYMVLLLFAKHHLKASNFGGAAITFALMAFAGGLAAFAHSLIDLPLPTAWRIVLAPTSQELNFNCNVLITFAWAWLPALMLGLAGLYEEKQAETKPLLLKLAALPLTAALAYCYGFHEEYLRMSGLLAPFIVAVLSLLALLMVLTLRMLEEGQAEESGPTEGKIDSGVLTKLLAGTLVLAAGYSLVAPKVELQTVKLAETQTQVKLSKSFKEVHAGPSHYFERNSSGSRNLFAFGTATGAADSLKMARSLLTRAAQSGTFPNLRPLSVTPWDRYQKGALLLVYNYGPLDKPNLGLTALFPLKSGTAGEDNCTYEYYTILATGLSEDIEKLQWELALTIKERRPCTTK